MNVPMPDRLTLADDGVWEMPAWGRTSDDEEWISYGWKVVSYAGHVFFRHKELSQVHQWLTSQGYADTGDGRHYQRAWRA